MARGRHKEPGDIDIVVGLTSNNYSRAASLADLSWVWALSKLYDMDQSFSQLGGNCRNLVRGPNVRGDQEENDIWLEWHSEIPKSIVQLGIDK